MMISSDTHAGPAFDDYAPYVDKKHMAAFQAELDARNAFRDHSSVGKAQGKSNEMNTLQQEQGFGPGTRDPEVKARHEEADGVVGCVIFPNGPARSAPSTASEPRSGSRSRRSSNGSPAPASTTAGWPTSAPPTRTASSASPRSRSRMSTRP